MSDDAKLENVAEDISVDEEQVSEVSEELVESDEVLDEAEELEEGSYGKMNAQKKKDDEVDEMDFVAMRRKNSKLDTIKKTKAPMRTMRRRKNLLLRLLKQKLVLFKLQ